ncbi:uncharacterized protein AMSG_01594 [Thecamonas trahens ATCC 50062]|uniref:Uncharacterized protein n=1 Tax=Thecamonas trahens ATCC 50062 TaxID=461836 RepID=A0A0L0DTG0_THETB|nr:hypothetical protein AMSG_01594 [Thecamonas trahens ATCC 50062]KNC54743.1 hypothetical protein AMSG_01594 [Thecamonas trahens ATCC 50062]|eukprot:XP_013761643.1 hypothetical protein AMSG_01594 [Thecamonas trahens ATCC 50062]
MVLGKHTGGTFVSTLGLAFGLWVMVVVVMSVAVTGTTVVAHVRWPTEPYEMEFAWSMAYPWGEAAAGPMLWRSNGTAVAYNITVLGFQQLQIGGTVWNWYPASGECNSWHVEYDLTTHWFDNATAIAAASPVEETSFWVGSLATPASGVGADSVPYTAVAEVATGIPIEYVAVGILPVRAPSDGSAAASPGSEVLRRVSLRYGPQDAAYFELPDYCTG